MDVYFVRHGETEWNRSGRWQGSFDVGLSELGRSQAEEASSSFSGRQFDAIYASDLRRAWETAEIIKTKTNVKEIIKDSRLRERALGEIEGKTTDEVSHLLSMDINIMDIIGKNLSVRGMETLESQFQRVGQFIEDLKKSTFENVIVVSHGVTIGVMLEIITGKDFRKRKIDNCEIIRSKL